MTAEDLTNNIYCKILEACVIESPTPRHRIAEHASIGENHLYIEQLESFGLIQSGAGHGYYKIITSQGMSAFLQLQSQKQASNHASRAIRLATLSIWIAISALIVNIIMMIFNFS